MTDTFHYLITQYGLIAVFLGCVAEGESAAMLGGFFAHQGVFILWQVFILAFVGAWIGDTLLFLVGRRFADHRYVNGLRSKPGFAQADRLLRAHPDIFVLANRYIYGVRFVGGIAAGLSGIKVPRFMVLNAISALVWAAAFCAIGYTFGLGAERLIGKALADNQKVLIGAAAFAAVLACGALIIHYVRKRSGNRP